MSHGRRKIYGPQEDPRRPDRGHHRRSPGVPGDAEGEKVRRIVELQRADLSDEEERFLKMLSLHPRSVSNENFRVLFEDFDSQRSDVVSLRQRVILPLSERGLIDILESGDGKETYSAHPLMKLAYSSWLQPKERVAGHRIWADAVREKPSTYGVTSCTSLEELQPFVDATSQYLQAGDVRQAWSIFNERGTDLQLEQLGYFALCLELAEELERSQSMGVIEFGAYGRMLLYDRLARVTGRLGLSARCRDYRRKQLSASNNLRSKANLVATLLKQGQIKEADKIWDFAMTWTLRSLRFPFVGDSDAWRDIDYLTSVYRLVQGRHAKAANVGRRAYEGASGHEQTVQGAILGEALFRCGRTREAENVLVESLEASRRSHYRCCELALLEKLVEMYAKESNQAEARRRQDELSTLQDELGLDPGENLFLLVAEGKFDTVLAEVSKPDSDPEDFDTRIERRLAACAAKAGKGETAGAARESRRPSG